MRLAESSQKDLRTVLGAQYLVQRLDISCGMSGLPMHQSEAIAWAEMTPDDGNTSPTTILKFVSASALLVIQEAPLLRIT